MIDTLQNEIILIWLSACGDAFRIPGVMNNHIFIKLSYHIFEKTTTKLRENICAFLDNLYCSCRKSVLQGTEAEDHARPEYSEIKKRDRAE